MARTALAYGDSNTHGTLPMADLLDGRRLGPEARWPGVAAAALGQAWRVVEEGLPGRTTVHPDPVSGVHKNGLAGLPIALDSHRPLDLVVLMLGTNDCKARIAATPPEIAWSVETLARLVLGSDAGPGGAAPLLLIVAPPPVIEAGCLAEIYAGGAAKSARLAGLYAAVAERLGAGFLDAGAHIACDPVDGVHFGPEAHEVLGRAVAAAIRDMTM